MPDSVVSALSATHFISFEDTDDDGWTDFFAGAAPVSSQAPVSIPSKARAALPLSIFGIEEAEEPQLSSTGFSPLFGEKRGKGSGGDVGDLVDLVKNLYVSPDLNGSGGGGEDFEESWEFQDAVENNVETKSDVDFLGLNSSTASYVLNVDSMMLDRSVGNFVDRKDEEEDFWDFQDALGDNGAVSSPNAKEETSGADVHIVADVHQSETKNTSVDFYCKLKDGAVFLIDSYINELKDAQEAASLSGAHGMAKKISGKIEEAQKKLLEAKATDVGNLSKYPSKDVCIIQLFDALLEPNIQSLAQEYNLSTKLLSAEKSLEGAIELLEHSALILHTLSLASKEEQNSYVVAWAKIAAVCLHELQNGALIWKESINEGVSAEMVLQGCQYFVALGEVYRSAEILKVSLKFYRPWLLSNWGEAVELVRNLDKCAEVWHSSGLEKAFERASGASRGQTTDDVKALHASIKVLHDLDNFLLQFHSLHEESRICKLSLLPLTTLPEMKMVIWGGDHYYVKLANLWANRISPYPPQLPCIRV